LPAFDFPLFLSTFFLFFTPVFLLLFFKNRKCFFSFHFLRVPPPLHEITCFKLPGPVITDATLYSPVPFSQPLLQSSFVSCPLSITSLNSLPGTIVAPVKVSLLPDSFAFSYLFFFSSFSPPLSIPLFFWIFSDPTDLHTSPPPTIFFDSVVPVTLLICSSAHFFRFFLDSSPPSHPRC